MKHPHLDAKDLMIINATCRSCGKHIEGKILQVSKAYLCPHCGEKNETIDNETLHDLDIYGRWHDLSEVPMLRPTKPPTKDMKVKCKCGHVFQVTGVYDEQIRICPKCGKSIRFIHLKQMCFACTGLIDGIYPETVMCVRCRICGSYEIPYK